MDGEVFRLAERLFRRYRGIVQKNEGSVAIRAQNNFFGKRVGCVCSVSLLGSDEYPYSVDASEETCSVKGGVGFPCKCANDVERALGECLKEFNFEEERQMSLFDL